MFVYSQLLDDVIADMAAVVERFRHIDPRRIVALAANRATAGAWGALAECVALGLDETPTFEFRYDPRRRILLAATPWFVPRNRRISLNGLPALYVLRFRFPRFLTNNPLSSIVHELLHISERFDGKHRALRHGVWFERYVRDIEREWRRKGDPSLVGLMSLDFNELRRRFGAVACRCFRRPFKTPLRLPLEEPRDWMSHPDVKRLGLAIGPTPPCRLAVRFDNPADLELTEKDLELRVFHPSGSARVSRTG
ncbi:MAG: hypothetical protein NTW86_13490 [Candidatus Sumerlaeota bacterium]|nr:hypothetical protein [Candidatus Sumerlaeota bacterium]